MSAKFNTKSNLLGRFHHILNDFKLNVLKNGRKDDAFNQFGTISVRFHVKSNTSIDNNGRKQCVPLHCVGRSSKQLASVSIRIRVKRYRRSVEYGSESDVTRINLKKQ